MLRWWRLDSQVYSFGIVVWEIASRRVPFEGAQPIQAAMAVLHHQRRPDHTAVRSHLSPHSSHPLRTQYVARQEGMHACMHASLHWALIQGCDCLWVAAAFIMPVRVSGIDICVLAATT